MLLIATDVAARGLDIVGIMFAMQGIVTTDVPTLIEMALATFATNSPGTNSTSVTPVLFGNQRSDLTCEATAGKTWTTEPTVLSVLPPMRVPTLMGAVPIIWLPKPIEIGAGLGFVLRCTSPTSSVNGDFGIIWST